MDLTPAQIEFHIAEFVALKEERRSAATIAAAHFRWAVVTSALVLVWLATEAQDFDLPLAVFFTPAAIAAALCGFTAVLAARTRRIGCYLFTLESTLDRKPGLGWEEHSAKRARTHAALYAALWALLLIGDIYAGVALQADTVNDQQFQTRQVWDDLTLRQSLRAA